MTLEISEIYIRNNNGSRTVPWGTPESTESLRDFTSSTITLCVLSYRNSLIHVWMSPLMPQSPSFRNSLWCGTVSKALLPGYLVDQVYCTYHGLSVKAVIHMNIPRKSYDYKVLGDHVCLGVTWYGKTLLVPLICKQRKSMKLVYNSQVIPGTFF